MLARFIGKSDFIAVAESVFGKGGELCFTASGYSMAPYVRNGDVLCVVPNRPIRIGDIALCYDSSQQCFAHRVVGLALADRCPVAIVTQGDACWYSDGPTPIARVLGRVRTIGRGNRKIVVDSWPYRLLGIALAHAAIARHTWFRLVSH